MEEEFELTGPRFEAQYPGRCAIHFEHKVKRGDVVSRVQNAENPMIPVTGVACKNCTKMLRGMSA